MILGEKSTNKGVYYLSEKDLTISLDYLKVRATEQRVLTDDQVLILPTYKGSKSLEHEWKLRRQSMKRFHKYLMKNHQRASILELGCGNGWFSNSLAALNNQYIVYGLDVNVPELEQAARVFKQSNLKFINGDIFTTRVFTSAFNIIVINAAVQYFSNLKKLFEILNSYLNPNGEIHIIDSPFYKTSDEASKARKRTENYYIKIGVPSMSDHYYHHKIDSVNHFEVLHTPKSKYRVFFSGLDNPFRWLRFIKN